MSLAEHKVFVATNALIRRSRRLRDRWSRGAPGAPLRTMGPCGTIPPGSRSPGFRPQRREETVMRRLLSAHVTSCLLLALALIAQPGCLVSPARA